MTQTATVYRMVTEDHVCPFGIKAVDLLQRRGFDVQDIHLETRAQTDAFKAEHDVKTTPQVFIEGERIGGYTDTRAYFGNPVRDKNAKTYWPVLVVFLVAALGSVAALWALTGEVPVVRAVEWFVAFSMAMLAMLKLRDLEGFTNMFVGYDVLARAYVPYAYAYPWLELTAAVLMIAGGVFGLVAAPIALFIGSVGAWSVFKAVYLEKRDLKCACVGAGGPNVPLGPVSLSENLAMMAMGVWMVVKALA